MGNEKFREQIDVMTSSYTRMLDLLPDEDVATRAVLERVVPVLDRMSQDPQLPTSDDVGEFLRRIEDAVRSTAEFEKLLAGLQL